MVASSSEKFVYTNPGMAHGQSRKSLVSRKYPSSKHTDEWALTKNVHENWNTSSYQRLRKRGRFQSLYILTVLLLDN